MTNVLIHTFKDSSVLDAGIYNATAKLLVIQFNSTAIWAYKGVPQEKFAGMLKAKSAGKYFNEFIRNNYESEVLFKPGADDGQKTQTQQETTV